MKRKKIDIRKLAYTVTKEELERNKQEYKLRRQLGIVDYLDANTKKDDKDSVLNITNKQFIEISTQYKSLNEYNNDKVKAELLIGYNKTIPEDLFNKLVQTRIELEQAGLLEPYEE